MIQRVDSSEVVTCGVLLTQFVQRLDVGWFDLISKMVQQFHFDDVAELVFDGPEQYVFEFVWLLCDLLTYL